MKINDDSTGEAPRIAVAVSAFKSDHSVIEMVSRILGEEWPVHHIVVVDSLGSGLIERYIAEAGMAERICYYNSPANLGSAGNLRKRLELGVALGADFVLALNHDAVVDRGTVESLLNHTGQDRIGALYPLRFRKGRGIYDLTGKSDFCFRARGTTEPPEDDLVEVYWSSSNGALYATAPLRERGIGPDASLWMCWEDYGYGLQLRANGYGQYIVTTAETIDDYEYRPIGVAGRRVVLAEKPNWYWYYSTRNMIITNLYDVPRLGRAVKTLLWTMLMAVHVLKQGEISEIGFAARAYVRGIADGLRNKRGKWTYP